MAGARTHSLSSKGVFIALLFAAIAVSFIPIIHVPFRWLETYFHEMSHGLMAVFTGGQIVRIELNLDGSGLCTTRGGFRFLVAFAGYLGASLFGALLYAMADRIPKRHAGYLAFTLAGVIAVSAVLYGRDPITWGIHAVLALMFLGVARLREAPIIRLSLKFAGLYVIVSALQSPLVLLGYSGNNDAATLTSLTAIPSLFWIGIWVLSALALLIWLFLEK